MRAYSHSSHRCRISGIAITGLLWCVSAVAADTGSDWTGLVSASMGHDSNVTLSDNSNIITSNTSDNFINTLGTAGRYLTGNRDDGVRINGVFYFRKYQTENNFDFSLVNTSAAYHKKMGSWYGRFSAKYNYLEFGGNPYQNIYDLTSEGRHKFSSKNELRLRYRYSKFDALSSQFDNTGGHRHRFEVEDRFKVDSVRYRLAWRSEINNLNDSQTTTSYTSSSTLRTRIRINAKVPVTDKWGSEFDLRWRNSRYLDDNVTPTSRVRRTDNRVTAKAALNYDLNKTTAVFADYTYYNNSSNISRYQYNRNMISVGLNYLF